jgi:hypothetical protein
MIATPITLRRILLLVIVATSFAFPQAAWAQCAGVSEEGHWRNLDNKGEPAFIYVTVVGGCGDQSLNGEQTGSSVHYDMRVWVRQPTGKPYGRPTVKASYRPWKGRQWLQGNVYAGAYQDQMWVHVEERNRQSQLHVYIIHKSLDKRPSYQSEYWFVK